MQGTELLLGSLVVMLFAKLLIIIINELLNHCALVMILL